MPGTKLGPAVWSSMNWAKLKGFLEGTTLYPYHPSPFPPPGSPHILCPLPVGIHQTSFILPPPHTLLQLRLVLPLDTRQPWQASSPASMKASPAWLLTTVLAKPPPPAARPMWQGFFALHHLLPALKINGKSVV